MDPQPTRSIAWRPPSFIRVVALCVLRRSDDILVFEGFDSTKGAPFYRPLGGGVEVGETAEQAAVREIGEEIGRTVTDLRLLGTIENIFTLEGAPGHEIDFVYEGRFVDERDYELEEFTVREADGTELAATWRPLDFFDHHHRLVPERLAPLLLRA